MLGAFMSGLTSGMESMLNLQQKADELRMQLDSNAQLREGAKTRAALEGTKDYGGGGNLPNSTPDFPIPTDTTPTPTTGSGDASLTDRGGGSGGTLGWGDHAKTVIDTLKGLGWKDGAIQGVLANGLAEGGFKNNWVSGDSGQSFGHFQFYGKGEMPGYLKWAGANGVTDPHDTAAQTQYLAKRMEYIHPGFGQIDNPYDATDIVGTRFERYKGAAPGQRYGHLATVQKYYNQPNYGLGAPPDAQTQVAAPGPGTGRDRQDPYPTTGPVASALPTPTTAMGAGSGSSASTGGALPYPNAPSYDNAPAPAPTAAAPAPTAALAPLTQKQQYDADVAAGRRPVFPPGQKFNSRGEAISSDLAPYSPVVKKNYFPARPQKTAALGDIYGGALT